MIQLLKDRPHFGFAILAFFVLSVLAFSYTLENHLFKKTIRNDQPVAAQCQPQPETCNGLDDDCNGVVDDHRLVDGEICGLDNCGDMVLLCYNGKLACYSQCPDSQ